MAATAAAAALAEVDTALTVCQADPNERQVFMVRECLNTLSDYAELTSKEVNDLASKFKRRTVADGRIVLPVKVLKNIQVFCFWAREKTRGGGGGGSLWLQQTLMQRNLLMRIREETTQEPPLIKPDKFSEDKWTSWKLQFVTYLSHIQGIQFALLDYVIRTEPPPGPLATMSQRDRELYRYPLNGRHYNLDNMMVYRLLSNVVSGTLGYTWIRDLDRSKNGRAAWMALVVHYEGGGQCEKRMPAALATIKALHYKNESVFAYEDFSRKLLEAFCNLKDTDDELSEFQKVKILLEKIQITQPRAEVAKSHVRQNFRADVDGAIAYLGTEFADMFADAIVYKRGKSRIGALSQEPAYKRGKHEDGPQHRPDGTLILFFGVNVTDVSHSVSSDEYNDLGPRGQAYIFQERERLGLTYPPRSRNLNPGQGRGRGRGGRRHYHQERKVGAAGTAEELSAITDSRNNNTGIDKAKDEHANTDSDNKSWGSRNGASFGAGAYKRQ